MSQLWPNFPSSPVCCIVYSEHQTLGYCAQHTVNAVLQFPAVSVDDLFAIGRSIDAAEKKLLEETDESAAAGEEKKSKGGAMKSFATAILNKIDGIPSREETASGRHLSSANYDEKYGNFSVQVVIEALRRHKFECRMLNPQEYARTDLASDCNCFVVNYETHWFALRKLCGVWYDLNSFHELPQPVSNASLRAYLDDLRRRGFSIYLVEGELPPALVDIPSAPLPRTDDGRWTPTVVGAPWPCGRVLRDDVRWPPPPIVTMDQGKRQLQLTMARLVALESAITQRLERCRETSQALSVAYDATESALCAAMFVDTKLG